MRRILLLCLFLFIAVSLSSKPWSGRLNTNTLLFQPYHVTQTSIDQARDNDTLKVFFRIYVHDFLKDYQLFCKEKGLDAISGMKDITEERLGEYFNDRVRIYINRKLLKGKLVSQSTNGYEMSMSLVFKSVKNPGKFKIQNEVLTSVYSDQANMIYLNINNYQDAMKLTAKKFKDSRDLK